MTYPTWFIIIAVVMILLAFIVPILRKSRISSMQNIDYISQFAMFISGAILLLPKDQSQTTLMITLILLIGIPVLVVVQYLVTRWRIKRSSGLKITVTEDERTANIYVKSARNALFANNFTLLLLFLILKTIDHDSLLIIVQSSTLVFWASYFFYYYRKV